MDLGYSAQRLSASEVGSLRKYGSLEAKFKCSTPFGIRGWFTSGYVESILWLGGAQRLSASEVGSPAFPVASSTSERLCSTPFGIRGWFTRNVLPRSHVNICAQRLSASEVGSLVEFCMIQALQTVLNAFRHQRLVHWLTPEFINSSKLCSTPFGIRGWFTTG